LFRSDQIEERVFGIAIIKKGQRWLLVALEDSNFQPKDYEAKVTEVRQSAMDCNSLNSRHDSATGQCEDYAVLTSPARL
jgi:hypothetical protein